MPRIWQALVDQELHAFFGRGDHAFEQGAGVSVELKLCDPVGICQHVDDTGADFVQLVISVIFRKFTVITLAKKYQIWPVLKKFYFVK